MTKSELYLPDTAFIGPGLLFLNQYFNSFVDEYIVLWIAAVSWHTHTHIHTGRERYTPRFTPGR